MAMHVSNNLKLKLKASRAATKLYHRCCMGSQVKEKMSESEGFSDSFSSDFVGCEMEEQMTNTNGRSLSDTKNDQDQDSRQGELTNSDYLRVGPFETPVVDINNKDGLIISGFDV